MNIRKPELLAPVGGRAHLTAAVNSGADAVYMGGMTFNARIFADNFTDDEIPDAIRYAHMHGVKVYMTLNTLVRDDELARAFEYANYIYGAGVDGIIVQDMGLARLIRKYIPDMPLHLSTQGTLHSSHAVSLARDLGFCRVVPARELTLEEIREVCEEGKRVSPDDPIDVEVFVHGAMCMCYSGQCQMSRMLGGGSGRTGNRGTCAQPCRHMYTDENGRTYYALSPKDMCQIENIPDLVRAGAASFKIEGRMKSPEYVAVVTGIYRKYIDRYCDMAAREGYDRAAEMYSVDEEDMLMLRQIFSRGDFTSGYLYGNPGEDLLSGSSPKNQGLYIGKVAAVLDSESKAYGRDERAAVRGALRRGKVLACIAGAGSGIKISQGDGLEFRRDEDSRRETAPVGSVTTYVKNVGGGMTVAGDFDRGIEPGDLAYKTTDRLLLDKALDLPEKKLPVTMIFTSRLGQHPTLEMTNVRAGETAEITADHITEQARKTATDRTRIESSLNRLGDTPFSAGLTGIDIEIDDDIMMPVSIVNSMRRSACDELMRRRENAVVSSRRPALTSEEITAAESCEKLGEARLDIEGYEACLAAGTIRPVPLREFMEGGERKAGEIPYILNVSKGALDRYIEENFDQIAEAVRDTGILLGSLSWIREFTEAGVRVYGDYGLNVYNEQARKAYEEAGVTLYMPSHETGMCDERGIPLMITEHPVHAEALTDRKGAVHRVVTLEDADKTVIY